MKIKTVEEYRATISKTPNQVPKAKSTEVKYFVAGFVGAMKASRTQERKANKGTGTLFNNSIDIPFGLN